MVSDNIHIPDPVAETIKSFSPSDRKLVAGVFALLEDECWRDTNKIAFGIIHNEHTWAIAASRVTVGFVEETDRSITIMFVNMRSRFQPSWL